jgi:hypothetical protein
MQTTPLDNWQNKQLIIIQWTPKFLKHVWIQMEFKHFIWKVYEFRHVSNGFHDFCLKTIWKPSEFRNCIFLASIKTKLFCVQMLFQTVFCIHCTSNIGISMVIGSVATESDTCGILWLGASLNLMSDLSRTDNPCSTIRSSTDKSYSGSSESCEPSSSSSAAFWFAPLASCVWCLQQLTHLDDVAESCWFPPNVWKDLSMVWASSWLLHTQYCIVAE